jgi:hypothetical protein
MKLDCSNVYFFRDRNQSIYIPMYVVSDNKFSSSKFKKYLFICSAIIYSLTNKNLLP